MTTYFDPRTVHHHQQQFRGPQQFGPQQFGPQQFGPQGFPGQQFPGPVPPAAPVPKKRPIAGKIIAGLVAAGLVIGGAGAWVALSGSGSPAVQATSFAGANPTTDPFGTDHAEVATVAASGEQSGDTAGLYAATTPPACDNAAFLAQLQADPAKLAAWGGVYGLQAADVPAFVDSLSPAVLRAATAVTDHPFREGAFVEEPVVLAAGTAVLVNSYGEPTVKCFNGNPLTAGQATAGAVTINPTTRVITNFRFTSIDNSRVVVVPGKPDPKPVPGPNKPPTTTPAKPDPVLGAKAEEAQKLADQARKDATESRERADSLSINARVFRSEADRLEQAARDAFAAQGEANRAFNKAAQDLATARDQTPPDPDLIARLQDAFNAAGKAKAQAEDARHAARDAADRADREADTAESQLKNAESKARNDENVAKAAEEAAKKAKEAAEASAKPATKPATGPGTEPGTEPGQAPEGETPAQGTPAVAGETPGAPVTEACTTVATADAPQAPICPAAGSAQKAATGTGTATAPTATGTEASGAQSSSTPESSSSSESGAETTSEATES
ncbi:DUF6777 domain-containing protein [Actinomycetospora sp. OC33-EN08]|uniref:DUF6777 domain-containing protein n=1 Tax=Actinomycetospora aurantiaca TaxID=3129233 RepID=A0ABU8MHT3_9PSEU